MQHTHTQLLMKVVVTGATDENGSTFTFQTVEEAENFAGIAYKPGNCHYNGGFATDGKVCPEYLNGDILYVFWNKKIWVDVNIDARKIFKGATECGADCGTVTRGNYTIAGIKGEKGVTGVGAKGSDGEKGEDGADGASSSKGEPGTDGAKGQPGVDGQKGADGETGAPGPKGAAGADGEDGEDGADGQNVDLGNSAIVRVDGINYGARLMGICVNGAWKYTYVFASEPHEG